jgi:hypothetical protein
MSACLVGQHDIMMIGNPIGAPIMLMTRISPIPVPMNATGNVINSFSARLYGLSYQKRRQ